MGGNDARVNSYVISVETLESADRVTSPEKMSQTIIVRSFSFFHFCPLSSRRSNVYQVATSFIYPCLPLSVQLLPKHSRSCLILYYSPVNMWFDLDKIATETLLVGNGSHTHPEQHIENIEQSKKAKVVNLHKFKMATQNQMFCSYDPL